MTSNPNRLHASAVKTLALTSEGAILIDQTRLPGKLVYQTITDPHAMAEAIQTMIVRGAPAIGIAGAYGVVLSARKAIAAKLPLSEVKAIIKADALMLREARPTAVNLAWAIDQLLPLINNANTDTDLLNTLTQKAQAIFNEDLAACQAMGDYGASLITKKGAGILTHCNAGALATAGYGTALGVVRSAFANDPTIQVYADETRPRLQGARLTTWELVQDGIPVTLICEGMSATLMRDGKVDLVVVGADRIAANGDTANKIGTYQLAIAAHAHNIPFYVVAPRSTIDVSVADGSAIPIEYRNEAEVHTVGGEKLCPEGVRYYNPAFDVTPAHLITAIITERGVTRADYQDSLARLFR